MKWKTFLSGTEEYFLQPDDGRLVEQRQTERRQERQSDVSERQPDLRQTTMVAWKSRAKRVRTYVYKSVFVRRKNNVVNSFQSR